MSNFIFHFLKFVFSKQVLDASVSPQAIALQLPEPELCVIKAVVGTCPNPGTSFRMPSFVSAKLKDRTPHMFLFVFDFWSMPFWPSLDFTAHSHGIHMTPARDPKQEILERHAKSICFPRHSREIRKIHRFPTPFTRNTQNPYAPNVILKKYALSSEKDYFH